MRRLLVGLFWGAEAALAVVLALAAAYSGAFCVKQIACCADRTGSIEICTAAQCGQAAVVDAVLASRPELIDSRDQYGWTPLHEAARGGYVPTIRVLLARGADVHARTEDGDTPLHMAARAGEPEAARLLLARGANPEVVNDLRQTPLDATREARSGRNAVRKILIRGGHALSSATR